jgi:hypothetical protein
VGTAAVEMVAVAKEEAATVVAVTVVVGMVGEAKERKRAHGLL